jgi:hypothetical protein
MSYTAADFRLICAWCNTIIRDAQSASYEEVPESHGVCHCCAVKMGMPAELLHN